MLETHTKLYYYTTEKYGNVLYETLVNLHLLGEEKRGETNEKDGYRTKANEIKALLLAPLKQNYLIQKGKYDSMKTEINYLMKNRKRSGRKQWWIRTIDFIQDSDPTWLNTLSGGIEQVYDTKFTGSRKEIFQMRFESFDALRTWLTNGVAELENVKRKDYLHSLIICLDEDKDV